MGKQSLLDSELGLSPLGLGTVEMGIPYGIGKPPPPPDEECISLLHHAVESGINYIDTASLYGRSEEIVGKAFAGIADPPMIATKVNLHPDNKPEAPRGAQLRTFVEESVQRSLKLLHTNTLDLLQLHNAIDEDLTPEFLEIMTDLRQRGWVKYLGATTYGEDAPGRILDLSDHFGILQVAYNVLDRRLEKRIFPRSKSLGVGLVVRSVFLQGALSDRAKELPAELTKLRHAVEKVADIAVGAGISVSELALRYVAYNPNTYITLFGTTCRDELHANIAAYEQGPLANDVLNALNAIDKLDDYYVDIGNWIHLI